MSNKDILMLSKTIKQARKNAGLSQYQLAHKLGVSDKTVSAYESSRAIPPLPTLKKIAEITCQPLALFLKEDKDNDLILIHEKLDIIIRELKKLQKV